MNLIKWKWFMPRQCRWWWWNKWVMRTEVKNFIVLIIVIRVNLADQRPFDLRSPINVCRECGIVFARKFNVVYVHGRIRCVVKEEIVTKIKWRLRCWNWRREARIFFIKKYWIVWLIVWTLIICGFWIMTPIVLRSNVHRNQI